MSRAPAALALGCWALAGAAWGFSNYAVGEVMPEASLAPLQGGSPQPWLGKEKVTVFFFFTPGSPNSQRALKELAALGEELAGKPVAFVGLVSSNAAAEAPAAVAEARLAARVLVDQADGLYGKLGTALTPVVGVTDEKHKLLAYLPFNRLQYRDTIRGWVRFGLGELNAEQLQAVLAPPPAVESGKELVAGRYLKLAERQLVSGNLEGAVTSAQKSLEAAELAGAHAVLGVALAQRGDCAASARALERALALDPANARAKDAPPCGGSDGGAK